MPISRERPRAARTLASANHLALFDVKACFEWAWEQHPAPPAARRKELLDAVIDCYNRASVFRDDKDAAASQVVRLAMLAAYAEARDLRIDRTAAVFPYTQLRTMEGRRCAVAAARDGNWYATDHRPRLPFVGCDCLDCACSIRTLTTRQYQREIASRPLGP